MAQALISMLAARMGIDPPQLDGSASKAIEQAAWPGNLRQMRTVLSAVLAAHSGDQPVSRADIEAQLRRFPFAAAALGDDTQRELRAAVGPDARRGRLFSFGAGAVGLPGGHGSGGWKLSAAARLLGLTRAQLAYRIGARDGGSEPG